MPLNLPDSAVPVDQRAKTDVERELPESNPFLKNSWLGALVTAYANRIYDFYLQLKQAILQSFPNTATGSFLEQWASVWGLTRTPASAASGNIVVTGQSGASVPGGTNYAAGNGEIYTTTISVTILDQVLAVNSITRVGNLATVETAGNHKLASNVPATIAGADQVEYNVTEADVQVTGLNTFTYEVVGSPVTPATGVITVNATSANIPVQSQGFGSGVNQLADAPLTVQSPIVSVDDEAKVDFGEIGGGTDQESDAGLRTRLLERIQNPIAHFNSAEIISVAKEIPGVTRVFVQEITPAPGQVTIYFMRDNDDNPIPSGSEIATVKDQILSITPANTDELDVIVLAPVAAPVDFTFSALTPNTPTMHNAINANLDQFFSERVVVGVNIDEDAYRSAIFNTIDTETGQAVQSFDLTVPVGDIVIAGGEIGTFGNVVYP